MTLYQAMINIDSEFPYWVRWTGRLVSGCICIAAGLSLLAFAGRILIDIL